MTQQKADPLRHKALGCLREGRVSVLFVSASSDELVTTWQKVTPVSALARVRSSRDGHPYRIKYDGSKWSCDCREGRRDLPCAHTLAVALVTTGVTS